MAGGTKDTVDYITHRFTLLYVLGCGSDGRDMHIYIWVRDIVGIDAY